MERTSAASLLALLSVSALVVCGSVAHADTQVSSTDLAQSPSTDLPVFNFRVAPMGLLTASPGIHVDVGLSPSFSLGPSFQYFASTQGNVENEVWQAGLEATYYFNHERYYNSWYTRAGVYGVHSGATNNRISRSSVLTSWVESIAGGYTFRLSDSHFNATVGTGLSYFANSSDEGIQPILELYFGWAI